VIVCLGAFNTPQLLQASGIGAKDDLERIGVESKVELEGVGKGLKDHLMAGVAFKSKKGESAQYLTDTVKSVS